MESKELDFFENMKTWRKPDLFNYCLILIERMDDLKAITDDSQQDKAKREKAAILLTKATVRYENVLFRFNNYEVESHIDFELEAIKDEIREHENKYVKLKREKKKWKLNKQLFTKFFSGNLFRRQKR